VYDQVQEFKSNYQDLISDVNKNKIERFLKSADDFSSKFFFLFDFKTVRREKLLDNLLLKIVIIFSGSKKSNT
jgi:hypothetical protein